MSFICRSLRNKAWSPRLPISSSSPISFDRCRLAANPSAPEVVADVIWQAANESGGRLRLRASPDAKALLDERKAKSNADFIGGLKALMKG